MIDVSADCARRLLFYQRSQIVVFADKVVTGRDVDDDLGSGHGGVCTGRDGCPQILAYFHAYPDAEAVDKQMCAERNLTTAERDRSVSLGRRRPPAFFVKFVVIGDVGLGDNCYKAMTENESAVVERAAVFDRGADDKSHVADAAVTVKTLYRADDAVEQRAVMEKVAAGIACDRHFRKHNERRRDFSEVVEESDYRGDVCLAIGRLDGRHRRRHSEKTVFCHLI